MNCPKCNGYGTLDFRTGGDAGLTARCSDCYSTWAESPWSPRDNGTPLVIEMTEVA